MWRLDNKTVFYGPRDRRRTIQHVLSFLLAEIGKIIKRCSYCYSVNTSASGSIKADKKNVSTYSSTCHVWNVIIKNTLINGIF